MKTRQNCADFESETEKKGQARNTEENTEKGRKHLQKVLITTWALFAKSGKVTVTIKSYSDSLAPRRPAVATWESWVYNHIERHVRGLKSRSTLLGFYTDGLETWDELEEALSFERDLIKWLKENPVPPMESSLPDEAEAADERMMRAKRLTTAEVAIMLEMSPQKVRASFECSRIIASKNHLGEWETTRGDVLDYMETRKRRGPRRKVA